MPIVGDKIVGHKIVGHKVYFKSTTMKMLSYGDKVFVGSDYFSNDDWYINAHYLSRRSGVQALIKNKELLHTSFMINELFPAPPDEQVTSLSLSSICLWGKGLAVSEYKEHSEMHLITAVAIRMILLNLVEHEDLVLMVLERSVGDDDQDYLVIRLKENGDVMMAIRAQRFELCGYSFNQSDIQALTMMSKLGDFKFSPPRREAESLGGGSERLIPKRSRKRKSVVRKVPRVVWKQPSLFESL